ncbi:uncharacterized protein LOC102805979 [Saccoglossus kowalevskii]|uniref:Uncharacterized protein LOC102805979 n=1 Tax=Saccoglossus kowalevskii TaxID=10224 RepID=A0ABM0MJV3_SACKO|nr:PREDICTED: uncharacterized protein LOC102805979 [Saccoglossus kowalevskii]
MSQRSCLVWIFLLGGGVLLVSSLGPEYGNRTDTCGVCQNGGMCNDTLPQCICPKYFRGNQCEEVGTYDCNRDGCLNGGHCLLTGICHCPVSFYGDYCQYRDGWWYTKINAKTEERSTIVSITSAMIVLVIICSTIICMNLKRDSLPSRIDSFDSTHSDELPPSVHVDGPPRMRPTPFATERESADHVRRAHWMLPFQSLPNSSAIHNVPDLPQAVTPRKYTLIVSLKDETTLTGPVLTTARDSQNSIPPSYEEVIRHYGQVTAASQEHESSESDKFTQISPLVECNQMHDNFHDRFNHFDNISHQRYDFDDMNEYDNSPGYDCNSLSTPKSEYSGLMFACHSTNEESLPFLDKKTDKQRTRQSSSSTD